MRFKQFLKESSRTAKKVSVEDAAKWIKKNAPVYWSRLMSDQTTKIYRGDDVTESYAITQSGSGRKSAHTLNFSTLLIDNSNAWESFPLRNESYICTNDKHTANAYAEDCNVVIPTDHTVIGIASDSDMWYSFPNLGKIIGKNETLDHFNAVLDFLGRVISMIELLKKHDEAVAKGDKNADDYLHRKPSLVGIDDSVDVATLSDVIDAHQKEIIEYCKSKNIGLSDLKDLINDTFAINTGYVLKIFNLLDAAGERSLSDYIPNKLLNPKANGFSLKLAQNLPVINDLREMWFSGEALFVSVGGSDKMWDQLVAAMKEEQ